MTGITTVQLHRWQAVLLLLAYTICAMSFGRALPTHPVLSAFEFTSGVVVGGYLLAKLVFHCAGQEHQARAKKAAKVVPEVVAVTHHMPEAGEDAIETDGD